MMFKLVAILILFIFNSCSPPMGYYWGRYSHTLYKYKKNQTPESYTQHKNELLDVIEQSKNRRLRVPPGVYAELGYIYLLENNNEQAVYYFNNEKKIYPESSRFMDSLIKKIEN